MDRLVGWNLGVSIYSPVIAAVRAPVTNITGVVDSGPRVDK